MSREPRVGNNPPDLAFLPLIAQTALPVLIPTPKSFPTSAPLHALLSPSFLKKIFYLVSNLAELGLSCGIFHCDPNSKVWESADKESACSAGNTGDMGSLPRSGRSSGEGNGNPLQRSCLESPTDKEAYWAIAQSVEHD